MSPQEWERSPIRIAWLKKVWDVGDGEVWLGCELGKHAGYYGCPGRKTDPFGRVQTCSCACHTAPEPQQ